ncbi:hypothetical protein G6F24_017618 [Rhizopus arrhizus]|nr:hypothetical protein G6F24_017618 [Rhizopus arrhizus]
MDLSGKITVMAGPYAIDDTGKQLLMPFPVVQLLPGKGMVPVWPADVATAKPPAGRAPHGRPPNLRKTCLKLHLPRSASWPTAWPKAATARWN